MNAPTPSLDDLRIDRSDGRNSGRRWPWVVAVCLLLVSGGGGWWWWTGPAQVAEVRTATARASTGSTEESTILNASGYVTARRRATVSSKVTGKLVESALLAVIGGVIGGGVASAAFHGYQTATMNFQTFSQVAFTFTVTPALLLQGATYALVMGLLGGFFPAIRAARLPIVTALRDL